MMSSGHFIVFYYKRVYLIMTVLNSIKQYVSLCLKPRKVWFGTSSEESFFKHSVEISFISGNNRSLKNIFYT